jgi:hypothetical protein
VNPDTPDGFAIDIDEDVIAAALASVDRRRTATPAGQAPPSPDGGSADDAFGIDVELGGEGASVAVDDSAAREVAALREELARLRFRLDEAAFAQRRAEQRAARAHSLARSALRGRG